jgi:tetratricopeptide (TPR) repeat protein
MTDIKYKAFISYSHEDEKLATWLQRALEHYRVPAKLRRQHADDRPLPSRLHPIFRDRNELASASDLSASIRSALDCSDALIVVCSPTAAKSKWVGEEIRYFQAIDRSARIYCLLVSGNPDRHHPDCAFPAALLESDDGKPLHDPLAADIRDEGDGKRGAMLKIAAALLGVGIDDLKHRDAQRKHRLWGAVAMGSLAVTVITIGFAIAAVLAREEAEIRRAQAEGLISFMLVDLTPELELVNRLDLITSVGDAAMDYFALLGHQGTEQEVFSRAIALRQIGVARFRQGLLAGAQQAFEESRDIAETLFTSAPDNNGYLLELSRAEFWVGYTALEQSQLEQTEASFTKCMEYSKQLLAREPENPDYQMEVSNAYSNLGAVAIERDPQQALEYFQQSLGLNQELVITAPEDLYLMDALGNGYSWVGATQLRLGRLEESEAAYQAAFETQSVLHANSGNRQYSEHFGENVNHLGNVKLNQGDLAEAESLFQKALEVFTDLVAYDPDNAIWRGDRGTSAYHQAELFMSSDRNDAARDLLEQAIADFEESVSADPSDLRIVENLALAERLLALLLTDHSIDRALALSTRAQSRMLDVIDTAVVKTRTARNAGIVAETHGRIQLLSGNEAAAVATWNRAFELLQTRSGLELTELALERLLVIHLHGESAAAQQTTQLADAGFDDPRFRLQP